MIRTRNVPPMSYIRQEFLEMYKHEQYTVGPTSKTVEVVGLQFMAHEPAFFGAPDFDYIEREKEWYLSQSLAVKDIPGKTPKIWEQVADENGLINSNYGWAVFSQENHFQYNFCVNQLRTDPATRRAVIQFNRPSMTRDAFIDGRNDYMCTYAYQFFIRNGQLDMLVYMRSMDLVYGYPNDRAWADHVFNKVLIAVNKPTERYTKGQMVWHCGSGHIYDRHFYLLDHFDKTGEWNVDKKEVKNGAATNTSVLG